MASDTADKHCIRCQQILPDPTAQFCPHCGFETRLPVVLTEGRFNPLRILGQGGMGTVYLVKDTRLDVLRAIKFLSIPDGLPPSEHDQVKGRIIQEAKAAQLLCERTHHVVRVFDVGLNPGDDQPYLVMEYLDGMTLKDRLSQTRLSVDDALHIGQQITSALRHAHREGLIHRDLKPENIMLVERDDRNDFVKLLDFGLVKMTESKIRTESGMTLGTLEYMAPEQLRGVTVDTRADVFALGAILYECFTGIRANPGPSQAELMAVLLDRGVAPLKSVSVHIPDQIATLVDTCLDLNPDRRPPNADAVFETLTREPKLSQDSLRLNNDDDNAKILIPVSEIESVTQTSKVTSRVIMVIGLLALGLVGYFWVRGYDGPPPTPPTKMPSKATTPDSIQKSLKTTIPAPEPIAGSISVQGPVDAHVVTNTQSDVVHAEVVLPARLNARMIQTKDGYTYSSGNANDTIAAVIAHLSLGRWPDAKNRWSRLSQPTRQWLWQVFEALKAEVGKSTITLTKEHWEQLKEEAPKTSVIPKLGRVLTSKANEVVFESVNCRQLSKGDRIVTVRSTVRGYPPRNCRGASCVKQLARILRTAHESGERAHLQLAVMKGYQRSHESSKSHIQCTIHP